MGLGVNRLAAPGFSSAPRSRTPRPFPPRHHTSPKRFFVAVHPHRRPWIYSAVRPMSFAICRSHGGAIDDRDAAAGCRQHSSIRAWPAWSRCTSSSDSGTTWSVTLARVIHSSRSVGFTGWVSFAPTRSSPPRQPANRTHGSLRPLHPPTPAWPLPVVSVSSPQPMKGVGRRCRSAATAPSEPSPATFPRCRGRFAAKTAREFSAAPPAGSGG